MTENEKTSTKNTAQTKTSTKTTASKSASAKNVEQTKGATASKTAKPAAAKDAQTAKPKAAKTAVKSDAKTSEKAEAVKSEKKTTAKSEAAKTVKTETAAKKTPAKPTKSETEKKETTKNAKAVKTERTIAEESVKPTKQSAKKNESAAEEVAADFAAAPVAVAGKKQGKKEEKEVKESKSEKTVKKAASESKSAKANGDGTATLSKKNIRMIAIIGSSVLLVLILVLSLVFGLRACNMADPTNPFVPAYTNQTVVKYEAEILGTVDRRIPNEVHDGGLVADGTIPKYPTYGYTVSYTAEQKNAVIGESWTYASVNTRIGSDGYPKNTFDKMDAAGNLYLNGVDTGRDLFKHTAAESMYLGNTADTEQAVIKRLKLSPRGYDSYSVTGLYAPAGEVIKIEISKEDMEANSTITGEGILVHIGQALYNRKANNIWAARNINRMPVILNSMVVNKANSEYDEERQVYTAYVGSFLGGPIYVHNTSVTTTVTISGGVPYSHFILGYTTPEEFEQNSKSTAPMFDMEVWEYGVLHSGPKSIAQKFSYDEIYKAAVLWEKISLVSTQGSNQGIVFLYDPFVAAGAAVAFPSQHAVNCPYGWMTNSLNYESFVNSGAWGNMHEYNHNFQGYGVGNGGEVTNNGMNLVEYSLFTRISRARQIGNFGAAGLSGWNRYTSPSWPLNEVIQQTWGGNGKQGLSLYATLLHNFGQDNFIQSKLTQQRGRYGQSYTGYFRAWTEVTHNNMSYFFNNLLGGGISQENVDRFTDPSYPMFVPVASVYQTGRSYMYDGEKKYISTAQPYVIPYGEDFVVDLHKYAAPGGIHAGGSIILPEGFEFRIKNVSDPENGTISNLDLENKSFVFKPNKELFSGKIIVTLEITHKDGAFEVDDVDLVLEFEQSHEMEKYVLERTTYSYTENKYDTAVDAYEAGFAGYSSVVSGNNQNPINPNTGKVIQNCNSEVWFIDAIQNDAANVNDGVVDAGVKSQAIMVSGKLYIDDNAKYRFTIRGRMSVALYLSFDDGKTFERAADYNSTNSANVNFPINEIEGTGYCDRQLTADTWVYYRMVMIRKDGEPRGAFMGLGWGKFTPPAPILDSEGNIIGEVPESVRVSYASSYRNSYEIIKTPFESDYFYTRNYVYNYNDNLMQNEDQTLVSTNYSQKNSWNINNFPVANLTDGNKNTFIHTNGIPSGGLNFEIDLGEVKAVNRMTIWSQYRPNGDYHIPKTFVLYGSIDGTEFFKVGEFKNVPRTGNSCVVNFEETSFRYYTLVITESQGAHIIIGEVEMWRMFEINGGKQYSPDETKFTFKGDWYTKSTLSTFGHVYVGKKGAIMEFEFEGEQLGILSSVVLGGSFDVYIDGSKVDSIALKKVKDDYGLTYLSQKLSAGKHNVKIKCLNNSANIDSIVVWKAQES